ncbi:MAG TPA: heme lyase CcmF/NrfE family subunit [Sphingomonadales bacterium]|nr:heme lyase CcmF/NrfE family subunit [Sphingomonadales bacterium]
MSAEVGHLALWFALFFAAAGALLPSIGFARQRAALIALARPLALGLFLFTAVAFFALMHAFVTSDFSVALVFTHSHTAKPLLYKIAGTWGNHEGSMLLWVLILSLFGALAALFGRRLPFRFQARVLSVQTALAFAFLLFIAFTSNPYLRFPGEIPLEGRGLNPILQDPGLAFHPPFLYAGFVGFSMMFSFALAALIERQVTPAWAAFARPWALLAWTFLTLGIAMGAWWAYYELGWGGFWFWDPVENASFMPWLAGTALLHSLRVVERRGALKSWALLLAILTFSLSLVGTFLVRSGVLTSVHAFASDPARGVFILTLIVIFVGFALVLYALRAHAMPRGGSFEMVSREGALVLNNLFLVTALATVFLGTLYPLLIDAVSGEKLSVGAPYYQKTFVPLMIPLIVALGFGPLLPWRKARLGEAWKKLQWGAYIIIFAGGVAAFALFPNAVLSAAGLMLGAWAIFSAVREIFLRAKPAAGSWRGILRRVWRLPRAHQGMFLAHFGLGMVVIAVTAAETWTQETQILMREGESARVAAYVYTLEEVESVAGPNYTAFRGTFGVFKGDARIATLRPEQRQYASPPMETTEAAIRSGLKGDLYAVIGPTEGFRAWAVRFYFKPLVPWIWFGALLMGLGGALSLSDRGARAVEKAKAPAGAKARRP